MVSGREHDIVLFGATGFVGKLTAKYLSEQPKQARIALAGRSLEKLKSVKSSLGEAAADWPLITADAHDPASLSELAASTRAIATTVGPFAKYGTPLVEACATAGTHYADLTGETGFVREMIDQYGKTAADSGARIVVSCGFDSIPSDLGVAVLHDAVRRDGAGDLEATKLIVTRIRGGISGGTIDSLRTQVDQMKHDVALRRLAADPYALTTDRAAEPDGRDERDITSIRRDRDLDRWLAPFVMASYNTRIVRRSNALQDWAYGRNFRYQEYVGMPGNPIGLLGAVGMTGALGALAGGMTLRPTRAVLDRLLPSPGEGPSEKTQQAGHYTMEIHATTSTGAHYRADVTGKGDPGYGATAVMLGESALALACDEDRLPATAGLLTPATGIGQPLVERLRQRRFTFSADVVAS
jgi:short subunit dehydrogenase-like uncharacterized protein